MTFDKQFLKNLLNYNLSDDSDAEIIEDTIFDHSRWSVGHTLIFRAQDKYFKTYYYVGATEYQEEYPFDNCDDDVECYEVEEVEKVVKVWQEVK